MIVVMGHLKIPPEKLDQAKPAIRAVLTATRNEPGCGHRAPLCGSARWHSSPFI